MQTVRFSPSFAYLTYSGTIEKVHTMVDDEIV